jgi:hypothetical protein
LVGQWIQDSCHGAGPGTGTSRSKNQEGILMDPTTVVVIVLVVLLLIVAKMAIRIVRQYEKGVLFRLGRVIGVREPGLRLIIPLIDRLPWSACGS